ncbi:GTPase-activating protein gyp8 [Dimargaris cristalligena]|nr:GTPase-activating protein gyp8 [Dimargaris cristalligena]
MVTTSSPPTGAIARPSRIIRQIRRRRRRSKALGKATAATIDPETTASNTPPMAETPHLTPSSTLLLIDRINVPRHQVLAHPDEAQLKLDVGRTHFPLAPYQQDQLTQITHTLLRRNSWLHYYQGLNDICTVFLLVLGPELAPAAAENASLIYFRDFMSHDFQNVHIFLGCIYTLIQQEDSALYELILETELPPYFATSWILTWFSHDLRDIQLASRLFDFFLTTNPLMPIYFATALVLHHRSALLALEREFPMLHQYLGKVAGNLDIPTINVLIAETYRLWRKHSARRLFKSGFHRYSCISTYPALEKWLIQRADDGDDVVRSDHGEHLDLANCLPDLAEPPPSLVDTGNGDPNDSTDTEKPTPSVKGGKNSCATHPLDRPANHYEQLTSTWPQPTSNDPSPGSMRRIWVQTVDRLRNFNLYYKPHYHSPQVSQQAIMAMAVYAAGALFLYLQSFPPI